MNKIHTSFVLRIGAIVGIIIIMISGLAFAEDVPEGQECCACAQDEAAFDEMVAEACQHGYSEKGIENPTEEQLSDCITQTKAQILENCPEQTTRAVEGDRDGDGVPDEEDNCPNVSNPLQMSTDPNVQANGRCRFIDNADGTVTDYKNRLVWLKDTSGGGKMTLEEAKAYCEGLRIAGGEWQLPPKWTFQQLDLSPGHPFMNVQEEEYWMRDRESSSYGFFRASKPIVCSVNGSCMSVDFLGPERNPIYYVWPMRYMQ